jgi:hypothetical protein
MKKNNHLNTKVHKVSVSLLLGFLLALCLCNCKKSCITCTQQGPFTFPKYDSSTTVSYDTVLHRYDTVLVKVDTVEKWDSVYILHSCPGSPLYNAITSGETLNWGSYVCGYDQ